MRVGLIDVDGHNYPNLPLMKLSAWHKAAGDTVDWYEPLRAWAEGKYDVVYMSKVFSFTPDYEYPIYADRVEKGGSGYCIEVKDGRETYNSAKDKQLPEEIEHIYPDYSIYGITDTAYGFLSRGCPRGCNFCHVAAKEGQRAHKVANLQEFWNGQKKIVIMDANILACCEWADLLQQLADSKALIDINQGLDIRLITAEKAEAIKKLRVDHVHFAWDRYEDKDKIIPKLREFKEVTGWTARKASVYVLTNYDTTIEQDLERIYTLRELGYDAYVMIYNKESTTPQDDVRRLQRWVNNKIIFKTVKRFEDYDSKKG